MQNFIQMLAIIYYLTFSADFFVYHMSLKNEKNIPKYCKNIMHRKNNANFTPA